MLSGLRAKGERAYNSEPQPFTVNQVKKLLEGVVTDRRSLSALPEVRKRRCSRSVVQHMMQILIGNQTFPSNDAARFKHTLRVSHFCGWKGYLSRLASEDFLPPNVDEAPVRADSSSLRTMQFQ